MSPLLAIGLVVATRKVLLSLGLGGAGANDSAFAALLLVALVATIGLDIGPMRTEERRAILEFVLLVVGVLGGSTWTGQRAAGSWSVVDILASADVTFALIVGGVLGLAAGLYYYVRDTAENPKFGTSTSGRGWVEGGTSMMPAVSILILAWVLGALVAALGTGEYLAGLIERASISPSWLVPIAFLIAAAMALATGTSWGSFGLLIPLVGGIINSLDAPELLLPALGAVLAGAVSGDHASPISDTTILSATGAGCYVITHVTTQLPSMGTADVASTVGYVMAALAGSAALGLAVTLVVTGALALVAMRVWGPVVDSAQMPDRQGTGRA